MKDTTEGGIAFARMIALGERLIEAQMLEESLGKACSRRITAKDLEAWKEARQWVDAFTLEYLQAVREWREEVEVQVFEEAKHRKALPHPLTLSRKPS
jgi:hypothetical protein